MPQSAEALTAAYVAEQRLLSTTLSRDLVLLVRAMISFADPGASWPAMKTAIGALVRDRRRTAGDLASRFYLQSRDLAQVATRGPLGAGPQVLAPRIVPVPVSDLDPGRLDANLNASGIASYQKAIRAGQPPEKAQDTMAVNLSGATQTLVLEGGREVIHETVQKDPEAIGWARVTDADPCAFCAMLASRGAVYRSRGTAGGEKNKQFVGDGMFKFHNHDGCSAVPVFDPEDPVLDAADKLYDKWLEVTRGHSGKKMVNAWTEYWNTREDKPGPQPATG